MRILITGGFGFLGGRLGAFLQQEGDIIRLGSRAMHMPPKWLPAAEIIAIDWSNEDALMRACSNVDVVIHAAGMNAQESENDPVAALDFNGLATARLVAAAVKSNIQKFIYLSTAHVYSSPLEGLITESSPLNNEHPYATSHLVGERAVLGARISDGIVVRLSNAFGSPVDKNINCWMLLVNDLCKQAVERKRITLLSSGMQYRNFIDIKKVCWIISALIHNKKTGYLKVLNVGGNKSITVLEMAKLIQARCEVVLGFKPGLEVGASEGEHRVYELLEYQSNNLDFSDLINHSDDYIFELDNLILFCKENFKYKK